MRSGKRCWCVVARRGCGLPMRDAFRGSTWNRETAQARGRAERVRFARARWPPRFHAEQEEALVRGRVERMRLAHARCPSPFTWCGRCECAEWSAACAVHLLGRSTWNSETAWTHRQGHITGMSERRRFLRGARCSFHVEHGRGCEHVVAENRRCSLMCSSHPSFHVEHGGRE